MATMKVDGDALAFLRDEAELEGRTPTAQLKRILDERYGMLAARLQARGRPPVTADLTAEEIQEIFRNE